MCARAYVCVCVSRCLLVITLPRCCEHYRCYNRISAGNSWSDVPNNCLLLLNSHIHTEPVGLDTQTHTHVYRSVPEKHPCQNTTTQRSHNNLNSGDQRIPETMFFSALAADPILSGINRFPPLISVRCCCKSCELFMSQT